jgi:hypothetical protein
MKLPIIAMFMLLPFFGFANTPVGKGEATDKQSKETVDNPCLTGTIASMSTYDPLEGVTLTITSHDGEVKTVAKTNEKGAFSVANLPAGIYRVKFEKKGYESGTYQSLTVHEGSCTNYGFTLIEK